MEQVSRPQQKQTLCQLWSKGLGEGRVTPPALGNKLNWEYVWTVTPGVFTSQAPTWPVAVWHVCTARPHMANSQQTSPQQDVWHAAGNFRWTATLTLTDSQQEKQDGNGLLHLSLVQ